MSLKIIMGYDRSQDLVHERLLFTLRRSGSLERPPDPAGGFVPYLRHTCDDCGNLFWVPGNRGCCDECHQLHELENELNEKLFRQEREVRLRELEKLLAES